MSKRTVITALAFIPTVILPTVSAATGLSDEAISGRVRSSEHGQVRVCFDPPAAPSIGQEFDVIRHLVRAPPKGSASLASVHAGILKIVSVDTTGCATGTLTSGTAWPLDWIATRSRP